MSTVDLDRHFITVTQAAGYCGKTPGRIRQICREYDIGTLIAGRLRLLSKTDLNRIKKYLVKSGKDFSKNC